MMLNVVFKNGTVLRAEIDDDEVGQLAKDLARRPSSQPTPTFISICGPSFVLSEIAGFAPVYDEPPAKP